MGRDRLGERVGEGREKARREDAKRWVGERARRDGLGDMVWKSTAYYHSADISRFASRPMCRTREGDFRGEEWLWCGAPQSKQNASLGRGGEERDKSG